MKTRIWLALLTLYLAWGSTYLAIHYAVQSIPPFFMTGVRFLVAGIILYSVRRFNGDPAPTPGQWKSTAFTGSLLLVGGIGILSWVEQFVPSGIAALIIGATPLWIVLVEAIRRGGNTPSPLTITGVLLGLMGIFILINPLRSSGDLHETSLFKLALLLLAALSWAIGSIYSRQAKLPKSILLSTGMELLAGSVGAFILSLITGETSRLEISSITLSSVAGLIYLTLVGSLLGFVCYNYLLRVASTNLVVTYAYINPLVALVLGSIIGGEIITTRVVIATPIILSAVILIHTRQATNKLVDENPNILQPAAGED